MGRELPPELPPPTAGRLLGVLFLEGVATGFGVAGFFAGLVCTGVLPGAVDLVAAGLLGVEDLLGDTFRVGVVVLPGDLWATAVAGTTIPKASNDESSILYKVLIAVNFYGFCFIDNQFREKLNWI